MFILSKSINIHHLPIMVETNRKTVSEMNKDKNILPIFYIMLQMILLWLLMILDCPKIPFICAVKTELFFGRVQ